MRTIGSTLALLLLAATARAQPQPRTLRFATSAPDGTAWAREARLFGHDVEEATHGELRVRWYFGGVTGDDKQTLQHIRARELDGMAAAGCPMLSPALRVANVIGLFRSRDEAMYVLRKIRGTIDDEMRESGVTNLGVAGFGIDVLFSRAPVRSFADLQRGGVYWVWDLDEVGVAQLRAMGVHVKALSIRDAGRAYDSGQIDGFVVSPSPALAFQWSTQAHYFTDLQIGFAPACLVIGNATMDQLPLEQQRILHTVGERLVKLFNQTGAVQDEALLHQLFERQGIKRVPVDAAFRDESFEAARQSRSSLDAKLLPPAIFRHVLDLLADYRAGHRAEGAGR